MRRATLTAVLWMAALAMPAAGAHAATLSGTLVEQHEDPVPAVADGAPRVDYVLATANGPVALDRAQDPTLVGQPVEVRDGSAASGVQGRATPQPSRRVAAAAAVGARKVAVLLVNFTDNRSTPVSAAQIRGTVFDGAGKSVNRYYQQQSGGATSLVGRNSVAGDVYGWYSLPMASTGCDYSQIASQARAAAARAGVDLSGYDHVVYYHPFVSACEFRGLASLPGQESWINGFDSVGVIAHEIGHNMGVHHANAYTCTGDGGERVALSATCTSVEYADPVDVMGRTDNLNLMSGFHRARLGQLPLARQRTARAELTYVLGSVNDTGATAPGLLLVPRRLAGQPLTQQFALDLRTSGTPFDAFGASAASVTGVTIRLVGKLTATVQTQLIDTTPATVTLNDAPLQPGQTFTDPTSGVRIQLVRSANGSADVLVHPSDAPDTIPPTPPQDLGVVLDGAAGVLTWAASTDDDDELGVARYDVYRDGALVATTPATSHRDAPPPGERATYRVEAVDAAGNRAASASRTITLPDAVAPGAVPLLSASRSGDAVALRWEAASDNRGVTQYRVVRDGGAATTVSGLMHTDATAGVGARSYTVAATDARGNVGPATSVTVPAEIRPETGPGGGGTGAGTIEAAAPRPQAAGSGGGAPPLALAAAPPAAVPATARPRAGAAIASLALTAPRLTRGRARLPASRRLTFTAPGATIITARIAKRTIRARRTGRLTFTVARRDRTRSLTIRVSAITRGVTSTRVYRLRRGVITRVR